MDWDSRILSQWEWDNMNNVFNGRMDEIYELECDFSVEDGKGLPEELLYPEPGDTSVAASSGHEPEAVWKSEIDMDKSSSPAEGLDRSEDSGACSIVLHAFQAKDPAAAYKLGINPKRSPSPPLASSSLPAMLGKKPRASVQSSQSPHCQVQGCNMDLGAAKDYHRKHRVCEAHSKSLMVIVAGQELRFCQQCSRFHELSEFDQKKRSCRRRLSDHNARRRKPQPDTLSFSSSRHSLSFYGHEASAVTSNLDGPQDLRCALSLLSNDICGSTDFGSASPIHFPSIVNYATSQGQAVVHAKDMASGTWPEEQSLSQSARMISFGLHNNRTQ